MMGVWVVRGLTCAAVLLVAGLALPSRGVADEQTDYLIEALRTSGSFRVRSQAALSLGRRERNARAVAALVRALRDSSASVRIAAASSLGRVGDSSAVAALRGLQQDPDANVVRAAAAALDSLDGPQRYYVGIGATGAASRDIEPELLADARAYLRGQVQAIEGVVLAGEGESSADVQRTLQRQRLSGYFIDSSVVRIEPQAGGVRAVVSVIVNTYPGRDMRAMLNGAATVTGSANATARRRAVEGAFSGALRRLPEALRAADARGGQ